MLCYVNVIVNISGCNFDFISISLRILTKNYKRIITEYAIFYDIKKPYEHNSACTFWFYPLYSGNIEITFYIMYNSHFVLYSGK